MHKNSCYVSDWFTAFVFRSVTKRKAVDSSPPCYDNSVALYELKLPMHATAVVTDIGNMMHSVGEKASMQSHISHSRQCGTRCTG